MDEEFEEYDVITQVFDYEQIYDEAIKARGFFTFNWIKRKFFDKNWENVMKRF